MICFLIDYVNSKVKIILIPNEGDIPRKCGFCDLKSTGIGCQMIRHFISDVIGSLNGRARVLWALPVYVLVNAYGGISLRTIFDGRA
jgi:hypothetical protein